MPGLLRSRPLRRKRQAPSAPCSAGLGNRFSVTVSGMASPSSARLLVTKPMPRRPHWARRGAERLAAQAHVAAVEAQVTEHRPAELDLTRAGQADQPEHLAGPHGQRHRADPLADQSVERRGRSARSGGSGGGGGTGSAPTMCGSTSAG